MEKKVLYIHHRRPNDHLVFCSPHPTSNTIKLGNPPRIAVPISFSSLAIVCHKFWRCFTRMINSVGISDTLDTVGVFYLLRSVPGTKTKHKQRRLRRVAQFISCPDHKSSTSHWCSGINEATLVNPPNLQPCFQMNCSQFEWNWFLDIPPTPPQK